MLLSLRNSCYQHREALGETVILKVEEGNTLANVTSSHNGEMKHVYVTCVSRINLWYKHMDKLIGGNLCQW